MHDQNETSILEDIAMPIKRRTLLPWWMKLFCWICMFFAGGAFICVVARAFGSYQEIEYFGLRTNDAFSLIGIILCTVAIFKGITAWTLWFEKDYAIKLGMIDAVIGMILYLVVMFVLPYTIEGFSTNYRGEILLLAPYLIRLDKIKQTWERKTTIYHTL